MSRGQQQRLLALKERFMSKVSKGSACWLWTAYTDVKGYGIFGVGKRQLMKAHRYSYIIHKGPIPRGLQIDHLCRITNCVNPNHLEAVTNRENVLRGNRARGPRPLCKHGHPLSGSNLYINPRGDRECRTCRRAASARQLERRSQCAA
ncbi:MAG: HNH endonuclease signature motif containing protein [Gammaproteobacteria bacterium]